MKFENHEIAFLTIFSAAAISIGHVGGIAIMISGIPATATFLAMVIFSILCVAYLRVRKFGAMTFMMLIYGIGQVSSTEFGPPGLYKVPITLTMGLIFDVIVYLWKRTDFSIPLATGLASFSAPPQVLFYGTLLGISGVEKLTPILWIIAGSAFVSGVFGGKFGLMLAKRVIFSESH